MDTDRIIMDTVAARRRTTSTAVASLRTGRTKAVTEMSATRHFFVATESLEIYTGSEYESCSVAEIRKQPRAVHRKKIIQSLL